MIGIPVTKDRLNQVIGGLAQRLKTDFDEIATLKAWSDRTPQESIAALFDPSEEGPSQAATDDAYLVKLIIDELYLLRNIYVGADALANAKDFREQSQKAIGLGL